MLPILKLQCSVVPKDFFSRACSLLGWHIKLVLFTGKLKIADWIHICPTSRILNQELCIHMWAQVSWLTEDAVALCKLYFHLYCNKTAFPQLTFSQCVIYCAFMWVLNDSLGVYQHKEEICNLVMRWHTSIWYVQVPSANDGDVSWCLF